MSMKTNEWNHTSGRSSHRIDCYESRNNREIQLRISLSDSINVDLYSILSSCINQWSLGENNSKFIVSTELQMPTFRGLQ